MTRGSATVDAGSGEGSTARVQLFAFGWALAAWFHLLGNTRGALDLPHVVLAVAVVSVLLRPGALGPLLVLAGAGFWTAWEETPMLSNHWLLFGFVNLALVVATAGAAIRLRGAPAPERVARTFFPAARACLLAFYLFAAFAKLNSAFFDPAVSCATHFFDQSVRSIGLGGLGLQDVSGVQWAVIVSTATIELAIPFLLMVRRTRPVGVAVAVAFHSVLSIDRSHQFVDFTSLLTVLFLLFLPPSFADEVVDRARRVWRGAHRRLGVRPTLTAASVTVAVVGLALAAEMGEPTANASRTLIWWIWQPIAVTVLVLVIGYLRRNAPVRAPAFAPLPRWLWVVPALVVLNSLSPYLELKTAHSGNMYSNLRVVDGESNHFVVRRGLPLTDEHAELVRIVSSPHPGLQWYADQDLALTRTQLRSYLADNPDVAVTYVVGSSDPVTVTRAGDHPDLVEPVPWWRERLFVFRSVSLTTPEACLPLWGVAR